MNGSSVKKPEVKKPAPEVKKSVPEEGEKRARLTKGGWNLIIMGALAIVISVGLTAISLAIYHYSGDIYLDRSRPGYLPDEEEVENSESEEGVYELDDGVKVDAAILEEYIKQLKVEIEALDQYQNPFGPEALSDELFGL